ncbi:MAG: sugar phosphate isomerase/epimerase [Clostridia bacterium]|nr:sugar phosphate isomerase/epimerase [Clostridia bacterium]
MKLATTTADFSRFCATLPECLAHVRAAGFRYVDLSLSKDKRLFSANEREWRGAAEEIGEELARLGLTPVQAHSPNSNPFSVGAWEEECRLGVRSLEVCGLLGIPDLVVHAGYTVGMEKQPWYEKNKTFYEALFPTAEKTGVYILTENTSKNNLPSGFYLYTGQDMVEFIEGINHPLLEAVWDTGHGISEGCQYENITALGRHLRGLHVHDNGGRADDHGLPYTGILNLDAVINALIDTNYKGYFTFEAECALRAAKTRNPRQTFERDTRLLQPNLEMTDAAERLLYTIGKCALDAYGIFEI